MSHQSGITASAKLSSLVQECVTSGSFRALKVIIQNETLVGAGQVAASGSAEEDYDGAVLPMLEEEDCAYILYRLDSQNITGFQFLLITYAPDFANVRNKMLFASTRSTLKTDIGLDHIRDEMFGTVPEDVDLTGFQKHVECKEADAPLTMAEMEKEEIRAAETRVDVGASTKKTLSAAAISFPVSDEARAKLAEVAAGSITYVQLSLDVQQETINLGFAGDVDVDGVKARIPGDTPRYHVFLYRHNHEGDSLSSYVFIYSCPGFKCGIKERMLYSSCKNNLLSEITADFGISFAKKCEIDGADDWSQEFIYDQLHPKQQVFTQKFARPKKPGKGPSRLVRGGSSSAVTGPE